MWSADRNGSVEGDDETANILDSFNNSWTSILHTVRIRWQYRAELTLAHEIIQHRLGAPTATIPRILNTSIQNNLYNPSKNSFNILHM